MAVAVQLLPATPAMLGVVKHDGERTGRRKAGLGTGITVKVRFVLATSVPTSVITSALSSLVDKLMSLAAGASLTLLTVIEAVAMLLDSSPSFALKLKLSRLLKFAAGV